MTTPNRLTEAEADRLDTIREKITAGEIPTLDELRLLDNALGISQRRVDALEDELERRSGR